MSDDRPTYRERRQARADRLDGWADGREQKADAAHDTAKAKADLIPFGQPILVGHHSEGRDRRTCDSIAAGFDRAHEHGKKADEMRSKAANIRGASDRAIYSDDPDAVERLAEKIAGLEAEKARIKAYNATCKKGAPDLDLLDEKQRANILSTIRVGMARPDGGFPSYALSNLNGTLNSTRKRLTALTAEQAP